MLKLSRSLFTQVLLALVAGVLIGVFWPDKASSLRPLGDGFVKLIKMIIPVLVFCVVVHGIASAGDLKRVGRVGIKALVYFEVLTTVALGLGLLLAYVFQPGVGMNVDPKALDPKGLGGYADAASKLVGGGLAEFLMKLIPTNIVDAFAKGDVLQVLVFAVLSGGGDPVVALFPGLFVLGAGQGLCITPLTTTVLSHADANRAGSVSGALATAQQVGNAIGVAVSGIIFYGLLGDGHGYGTAYRWSTAEMAVLLAGVTALTFIIPPPARPAGAGTGSGSRAGG